MDAHYTLSNYQGKILEAPKAWASNESYLETLISHPWYSSIHFLLAECSRASHQFFIKEGANCALVPITTGSISSPMGLGSDSLPVQIEMGDGKTYLADSMQFYLELALRIDERPAYYLMSSFRGESSDARHLNQFYHSEVEIIGNLSDVFELAESYTRHLARALLDSCEDTVREMAGTTSHVERFLNRSGAFPRIKFDDAIEILKDQPEAYEKCETGDYKITSFGERALIERYGDFIWLTNMPASTVPFYQARDPENSHQSLTGDLLAGIGEILGSGERARTLEDVESNLRSSQVSKDDYKWYLDMKSRTPIPTSGFGMGIERFLMWITNTADIRDWALIPRDDSGLGPL